MKRQLHAIDLVPLDLAQRQPQRERRVGGDVAAEDRKLRRRDAGVRLALDLLNLVFVLLPQRPRVVVHQAGQQDHRVVRLVDRLLTTLGDAPALLRVSQFRAGDKRRGAAGG